jgi:hypothetical protein
MDDGQSTDEVRSAEDVSWRALALFSAVGLALGAERPAVLAWLLKNDLRAKLAPSEAAFIDTPAPSRKQTIHASWLSERLIMLLWSLGLVDQLPPADEQCDTIIFQKMLPPFASISVEEFVDAARLRPDAELIAMAEATLQLHWAARDARLNGVAPRSPVDIEVIQERHHAINWVIGYDGSPWDEVTTDT